MGKMIEYILVKKKDDFCNTVDQFKNLLLTNVRVSIENDVLIIGKCKIKFNISEQDIEVANELTFCVQFEALNEYEEEKQISDLEVADKLFHRIIESYANLFYINTIWDDISIYYASKAYSRINSIENKMRKIIYILMIRNIGSKWVEKNIPIDVKDSIIKSQEKNNIHNLIEDCLYSTDFIQLGYFLFKKYSINNNIQSLLELLKKDKKIEINTILDIYEAKSNWDRYFADEIQIENLLNKWELVYDFRNKVAHSKKIDRQDYDNSIKIINELEEAFDKSLLKVNKVNIPETEKEAIEELAGNSIEKNMVNNFENMIINPAYSFITGDTLANSLGVTSDGKIKLLGDTSKALVSSMGITGSGNINVLRDTSRALVSPMSIIDDGNVSVLGDTSKALVSSMGIAGSGNFNVLGDTSRALISSMGITHDGNISVLGDTSKALISSTGRKCIGKEKNESQDS